MVCREKAAEGICTRAAEFVTEFVRTRAISARWVTSVRPRNSYVQAGAYRFPITVHIMCVQPPEHLLAAVLKRRRGDEAVRASGMFQCVHVLCVRAARWV